MEIINTQEVKIQVSRKELMDVLRKHIYNTTGTVIPQGTVTVLAKSGSWEDEIFIWVTSINKQD